MQIPISMKRKLITLLFLIIGATIVGLVAYLTSDTENVRPSVTASLISSYDVAIYTQHSKLTLARPLKTYLYANDFNDIYLVYEQDGVYVEKKYRYLGTSTQPNQLRIQNSKQEYCDLIFLLQGDGMMILCPFTTESYFKHK